MKVRSATALPKFTPETVVFDAIYNPMRTKLLQQAEESGAKTIGGVEMFIRQAACTIYCLDGPPPPTDVMRRVIVVAPYCLKSGNTPLLPKPGLTGSL